MSGRMTERLRTVEEGSNMTWRISIGGLLVVTVLLLCGCGSDSPAPAPPYSYTLDVPGIGTVKYTLLAENGGRVSWYRGTAHNRIAYDGKSQTWGADYRTDIYIMNADGSNKQCVTCGMPVFEALYQSILAKRQSAGDTRLGFWIGQPEWHPDGVHVIIQVENLNSSHTINNFVSFGVDNDLWILNTQTKTAGLLWNTSIPNNAALHPRFSDDGSKLIFAQRTQTTMATLNEVWEGWRLVVADFNINSQPSSSMISNPVYAKPSGDGFYETTGFLGSSTTTSFSYSFTPFVPAIGTVPPYVAEGHITNIPWTTSTKVVDFPGAWDEKPRFSPSINSVVWMSSYFDTTWDPTKGAANLQSDLYLGLTGTTFYRFTFFNDLSRYTTKVLVTDHEWNRTGDKLVVQAMPNAAGANADIWLVELPQAY